MSQAIEGVWDGTPVERVVHGLGFTEGPTWLVTDKVVLFTDVPGNAIHQWSERDGHEVRYENSHFAIGLAQGTDGSVLVCEQSTRRVTRVDDDDTVTVLASSVGSRVLNAPNDIVVRSDGLILFTDPPYGVRFESGEVEFYQVGMEQPSCNVFAVTADPAAPRVVTSKIWRPNGICFSPDESILYVTDTSSTTADIYRMHLDADGGASDIAHFARIPAGVPDGIRVDKEGRLYASGLDGVYVYARTGALLGKIPCPEMVANCCFGGSDGMTLFLTASTGLYRVRVETPGAVIGAPGGGR